MRRWFSAALLGSLAAVAVAAGPLAGGADGTPPKPAPTHPLVYARGQMVGPIDGAVKVTPSGGISYATWHLKRGRYMIYRSMPGHFQLGMHARITVT